MTSIKIICRDETINTETISSFETSITSTSSEVYIDLTLNCCNISPLVWPQLVTFLKKYSDRIHCLSLRGTGLKDIPDFSEFADYLTFTKSLSILDISWVRTHEEGFNEIFNAIHKNNSIFTLDVSYNVLHDTLCNILIKGLYEHPTISELILDTNRLTAKSLPSICHLIKSNKRLLKLSIAENIFGYTAQYFDYKAQGIGFIQIAFSLLSNYRLQNLDISRVTCAPEPTKQLVQLLLARNRCEPYDSDSLSSLIEVNRQAFLAGRIAKSGWRIVSLFEDKSSWMAERDDEIKEMEDEDHFLPGI